MAEFNPLIQTYTVDFASNNNFLFIPAVQGDGYGSRYAIINLSNNGQPYQVRADEVRVIIQGTKLDGTQIFDYCEIMEDEVSIKVNITPQMTAVPGKNKFEIAIASLTMNTVLKSFPLYIMSSESAFNPEQALSSDEYQVLIKQINDIDELVRNVTSAEEERNIQEMAREASETVRANSEVARSNAEQKRSLAEQRRVEAENNRASAETSRAQNEQTRVANETARVNAETNRVNEWTNTLKPNVTAATEIANQTAADIAAQAENGDFSSTISSVSAVAGAAGTAPKVENMGTAQNAELVFTIPKGDTGAPFSISKTYSSVIEMNANYATDGVEIGGLVIIETGDVENEDNAKIYMKGESSYVFLVDLSGATGIKGEPGTPAGFGTPTATVNNSAGIPSVTVTASGEDTAKVFNFTFKNLKGEKGDTGAVSDTTPIAFTQASTRSNIVSGEAINVLFGKIAKYFADLHTVAFSGNYSALNGTPTVLKNPSALTFTGGSTASYDGSSATTVSLPAAANNLTTTASGYYLDARIGPTIANLISQSSNSSASTVLSNTNAFIWSHGDGAQYSGSWKPLGNNSTMYFTKIGNIVLITCTLDMYDAPQDSLYSVAYGNLVPAGYRPTVKTYFQASTGAITQGGYELIGNSSDQHAISFIIYPSGRISSSHSSNSNRFWSGMTINFCYKVSG